MIGRSRVILARSNNEFIYFCTATTQQGIDKIGAAPIFRVRLEAKFIRL